jgi:hypothetical protein
MPEKSNKEEVSRTINFLITNKFVFGFITPMPSDNLAKAL